MFETIDDNFPKLKLDTNPRIQEAQETSSKIMLGKLYLSISFSNHKKSKIKKKPRKKPEVEKKQNLPIEKQR